MCSEHYCASLNFAGPLVLGSVGMFSPSEENRESTPSCNIFAPIELLGLPAPSVHRDPMENDHDLLADIRRFETLPA